MASWGYGYRVSVFVTLLCRFERDTVIWCIPKQKHPLYARIDADASRSCIYRDSTIWNYRQSRCVDPCRRPLEDFIGHIVAASVDICYASIDTLAGAYLAIFPYILGGYQHVIALPDSLW